MSHIHPVLDTDNLFVIDPLTRVIKAQSSKTTVVQYDHNSERLSFELPRMIEGHDMATCTKVEVHWFNVGTRKEEYAEGVYEVDDLSQEGEDKVVCSWLIAGESTQYAGQLTFLLRYCCLTGDVVDYVWNTVPYEKLYVSKGGNASATVVLNYSDILEKWKASLFAAGYINADTMQQDIKTLQENAAEEKDRVDKLSNYVTPQMFGAKADGATDDTAAIQACFDAAAARNLRVEFVKGTYRAYGLTLSAGVVVNGNGATLKKPNLSVDPYNMTVSEMKWVRLLSVGYTGDEDSALTVIRDLEFDGNCWEMWSVEDGYAQEQASLLFLSGGPSRVGKLRAVVENCYFHDNPSDGLHVVTNVDVAVNNCKSLDCFRGGLVITGGNTTVNVDGFEFNSNQTNDGIDLEVDSLGYGDTKCVVVNLVNIQIDRDLDLSIVSGSRVAVKNLVVRKGGYTIVSGGELTIRDSLLLSDEVNYTGNVANMVYISGLARMLFDNVTFDGNGSTRAACRTIYYYPQKTKVEFTGCRFVNATWGISGSTAQEDAVMLVENCVFETDNGFGGNCDNTPMVVPLVKLRGNVFEVTGEAVRCYATNVNLSTLELSGNTVKSGETGLLLHAPTLILHDEVWPAGLAIEYSNGHSSAKYFGKRTNLVTGDPNGARGIEGKNFEDYATDGTTVWKFKSGTTWDVVS